ncbi:MAG: glycosyltransferase [Methylococcaceae bacterium]|nr:glycosyltransferase [Methylococcaceae bacterium]
MSKTNQLDLLRSELKSKKEVDEKVKLFKTIVNHPDAVLNDYLNFAILLRDNAPSESLQILDDAEFKFGENAWIEDNRARACTVLGDRADAVVSWEKAELLASEDDKQFFINELSRAYEALNKQISEEISDAKKNKRWDEVISTLKNYQNKHCRNLYVYLELCIAYQHEKDYINALSILVQAEKNNLKSPWIHDNYARIFFDTAHFKKSIRACLYALKDSRSKYERERFIELLTLLKEKLSIEHQNGKNLHIFPVDPASLKTQLFDKNLDPNEIYLDIYDNVSSEQSEKAFESIKNTEDFSKVSEETKILTIYYLPQMRKILEKNEESKSITAEDDKEMDGAESQSLSNDEDTVVNSILFKELPLKDQELLIQIVLYSGLFSHGYYAQQVEDGFNVSGAIEHFLSTGAEQGLKPMLNFDFQDYRSLNPDLPVLSNVECFIHYVLAGRAEKRYFSRTILKQDAIILRRHPLFDSTRYGYFAKGLTEDLSLQEHYLAIGWRENLPANRHFDFQLYLNCYVDASQSDKPPFLHYLKNGTNGISCIQEAKRWIGTIMRLDEFDSEYYNLQYKRAFPDISQAVLHYICHGVELKLNPKEDFNGEYYLRKNPDIKAAKEHPYIHYLLHGKNEGRRAKFESNQYIHAGSAEFDPNKPTILVACHEASRSGAPILGLQLMEYLSSVANIICWLGRKGPLLNDFAKASIAMISDYSDHVDTVWIVRELRDSFSLQTAILNSVATSNIAPALYEEKIPIVALVHEYADYMTQEVLKMLFTSNRVVFPAQGVKASAEFVSIKAFGRPTSNTIIRHQGRCFPPGGEDGKSFDREEILLKLGISEDDPKPAIVLGCGWVQMRKGLEYFIEAAKQCKEIINKPIRFVWVGGGYYPDADLHYSVWLKSQVIHSGLEDDVIFFEETNDLTPFFELADVFFMSSRLDPFPNVALDAVDAGVPVVAFEKATGFSDFIHNNPTVGAVVPFLDATAAAEAICEYISKKRLRPDNCEKIAEQLSFSTYAEFIWGECQRAIEQQEFIQQESSMLEQSKQFNSEFFTSGIPNWPAALPAAEFVSVEYLYAAMWHRGIALTKSRVGFNDVTAQTIASTDFDKDKALHTPLVHVLDSNKPLLTHKTIYINPNETVAKWEGGMSVALHIHAFYPEALLALLKRVTTLSHAMSIFVTTDTDDKALEISTIAKKLSLQIKVLVTPNRGRDVGPFIMTMKQHLSNFEVVGHFHLKGTKQLEQSVVRQWQDFLYNTLIGQHGEIADTLLQKLAKSPKLGLLFQEDPCLSNWSKNRELADKLLKDLKIERKTTDKLEYPTGNMFWARTAALEPLMKHDWQWKDFPAEPVPYDGSILHAIERLTPIICETANYEWATVHNPEARRYYSL